MLPTACSSPDVPACVDAERSFGGGAPSGRRLGGAAGADILTVVLDKLHGPPELLKERDGVV
jgi:hypothetical protein